MVIPCPPVNAIAVVFVSQRSDRDEPGYTAAAAAMEQLAAQQPGYLGFVAARSPGGPGIAVSYWQDDASAAAWRDQADHAAIRNRGRDIWYDSYALAVARVERCYDWQRAQP